MGLKLSGQAVGIIPDTSLDLPGSVAQLYGEVYLGGVVSSGAESLFPDQEGRIDGLIGCEVSDVEILHGSFSFGAGRVKEVPRGERRCQRNLE